MKGTLPVLTPDVLITKLLIYGLHLFGQLSHTTCENIKFATIFASKRYTCVPLIKLLWFPLAKGKFSISLAMIFLAKMIRIVQEHLIKLPHCSGWCLNVLVINRMVFSPLPTRRMSAHNITSPITSGNCIRIYYEYVSSRILSTRKKRGDVAFVKYIFQGLSSWKGRAASWRWFGVDQRKRLDSFPFPFIPPLTPPLPLPLAGLLGHSSGEESNVLSSGNQHLHFSACETFSKAAKELRPTEKGLERQSVVIALIEIQIKSQIQMQIQIQMWIQILLQ